eukprot:snap_masked-scaffold_12-processed-gene-9.37-mRNA-1 protein AED:1.00 eAED:1.00 QI:0/0/0/0/1/1/2/0/69
MKKRAHVSKSFTWAEVMHLSSNYRIRRYQRVKCQQVKDLFLCYLEKTDIAKVMYPIRSSISGVDELDWK